MKLFKPTLLLLAIVLGSLLLPGCAPKSKSTAVAENQIATVQRGDLRIDITATGNLVFSQKEDLAFTTSGTVAEVLVTEGDTIEKGQVLAKLDTTKWEDELATLERQITTNERNRLQMEISLRNTKIALEKAQNTYTWPDIMVAQAELDKAKAYVEYALSNLAAASSNTTAMWERVYANAHAQVEAAQKKLDAMLSSADAEEVAIKKLDVELAQARLKDAEQTVADAQKALAETKTRSPKIIANFAGFITKVNVKGGDEVKKGTVAVVITDPTKFEADILVNEMDIPQVKLGGNASVQVDALPGLSLLANVTHIAPTATIQSGIVNYKVKVEIESLQSVMSARQQASDNLSSANISAGLPASGFRQPFAGDNLTPEQIDRWRQQRQPPQAEQPSGQQQQMPTIVLSDVQLREGLTITVSIIVEQKSNVLLVPSRAITRQGRETLVQVLKDGGVQKRPIKTGLSNWQNTEVIQGLSEGEQVVLPQTTTTPTTPTPRGGFPFMPGGRIIR